MISGSNEVCHSYNGILSKDSTGQKSVVLLGDRCGAGGSDKSKMKHYLRKNKKQWRPKKQYFAKYRKKALEVEIFQNKENL